MAVFLSCCLIIILGDLADLIFVFFDPIGQALCKRTLNVVEELSAKHADRMRFYLSKVWSDQLIELIVERATLVTLAGP